jgi:hypothetical protein
VQEDPENFGIEGRSGIVAASATATVSSARSATATSTAAASTGTATATTASLTTATTTFGIDAFRHPTVIDARRSNEEQRQSSGRNEYPATHFRTQSI